MTVTTIRSGVNIDGLVGKAVEVKEDNEWVKGGEVVGAFYAEKFGLVFIIMEPGGSIFTRGTKRVRVIQ